MALRETSAVSRSAPHQSSAAPRVTLDAETVAIAGAISNSGPGHSTQALIKTVTGRRLIQFMEAISAVLPFDHGAGPIVDPDRHVASSNASAQAPTLHGRRFVGD
jgi:hypothetical protein